MSDWLADPLPKGYVVRMSFGMDRPPRAFLTCTTCGDAFPIDARATFECFAGEGRVECGRCRPAPKILV